MKNIYYLIFCFCFFFKPDLNAFQLGDNSSLSLYDKLSEIEDLHLTIITDLQGLVDEKYADEYQEATITIQNKELADMSWPAKVKARGVFRKRICDFPPIKLNFGKALSAYLGVEDKGALKLVTSCKDELINLELVEKEFLVYQMYRKLTQASFRTKMLKVHWIDPNTHVEFIQEVNFIIESKEELAHRLGGREIERYSVNIDSLDVPSVVRSSLYQYMVGNTDWSVEKVRNVAQVQRDKDHKITIVPYDFDFCTMVDAPYYRADGSLNLKYASDRIYLGPQIEDLLQEEKKFLKANKKVLFQTIKECPNLSNKGKREVRAFLQTFYDSLKEPIRYPSYYLPVSKNDN